MNLLKIKMYKPFLDYTWMSTFLDNDEEVSTNILKFECSILLDWKLVR